MNTDIKQDVTEPIFLRHLVAITTALIATGDYTGNTDPESFGIKTVDDNPNGNTVLVGAARSIMIDLIFSARDMVEVRDDRDDDEEKSRN